MIFILVFFVFEVDEWRAHVANEALRRLRLVRRKLSAKNGKNGKKKRRFQKMKKHQWNLRIFTIQRQNKATWKFEMNMNDNRLRKLFFFNRDSGIENGEKLCDVQWMSSFQVPKIAPSRPLSRLSMRRIRSCGKMKWKPIRYVYAMCHHQCRVIERSNWSHSSATPIVSIWEIFGSFDLKYLQCGLCSLQRSKSRDCSYSPTGQTGQSKLRFIFAV